MPEIYIRERIECSINNDRKSRDPYAVYIKTNTNWMKYVNMRPVTVKIAEESIGNHFKALV
jgi:hypothetical protein